jgi:hypothetical protein
MKRSILLFGFFFLTISAYGQNTLIVDNTGSAPTGDHVYTNLQAAIDAAQAGDVIQVMPSQVIYGEIIISKSDLTIIGGGFNPDIASEIVPNESVILNITMKSSPSNVVLNGLFINQNLRIEGGANLIVDKCRIEGGISLVSNAVSNSIFRRNLIYGFLDNGVPSNSLTFTNNIFYFLNGNILNFGSSIVNNNMIISNDNNTTINGSNNIFTNNIIHGVSNNTITNSVFNYNLSEEPLVVNEGSTGEFNITKNFSIPAILSDERVTVNLWERVWDPTPVDSDVVNGGNDGTNIGPTGGSSPYQVTSFSLPTIINLISPITIKKGTDTEVTIKAKGN